MSSKRTWAERAMPIERDLRPTTVAKTLWPGMKGTQLLKQSHGSDLVCVRYRHDIGRTVRYTTVEIVVKETRIRIRPDPTRVYGVRIDWQERELTRRARASGGTWDEAQKLWQLTGETVIQLGLAHRIRRR